MLTATYTLVALSVEQASVRMRLQTLQQYLQSNLLCQSTLSTSQVDAVCDSLQCLYDTCHWRKIEMFLIPAIRRSTRQADPLLLDLDGLNMAASNVLAAVSEGMARLAVDSEARVAQFCAAIDMFCGTLLQRLDLEEHQLFPVARSVISGEAWFSIANQMLVHDARRQERKLSRLAGPAARPGAFARDTPVPVQLVSKVQPDLFPASVTQ